jgi:putative heme transporter
MREEYKGRALILSTGSAHGPVMETTPEPSVQHDLDRGRSGAPRSRRRTWLRRAGLFVLSIACAWIIIDLVGSIDWGAVRAGIAHLEAWQFVVLIAVVIVRQVLNAMPLMFFIDGLSLWRATWSDQGSTLMSMIAPPTSDTVFRIVVMRSWGIDVSKAAAGSTCNILVFYVARWMAPLIGVLLLAAVRFDAVYGLTAAGSLLIAVAILAGVILVTRSRALARRLGGWAGGVAARVRKSIDPEVWASSVADFQENVEQRFQRGLVLSAPALTAKLLVDASVLVLAIRFVGIGQAQLSWLEIVAAFLVSFPLTLFPLQGIGVLDATLVAALTSVGGIELEAGLVAALVTYRVVTLGTPAVLGALFIVAWRHTQRRAPRTAST